MPGPAVESLTLLSDSGGATHSFDLRHADGTVSPIFTAGPCSSSMNLAWGLVERDMFPEWASILVESQWAGRGQQRRIWHSPPGNLYASVRLPRSLPPWNTMLSLLVGAMVLGFLENLGLSVELKWPNDVLITRRKIGGILLEEKSGVVIAGIGLNLTSAPSAEELGFFPVMPAACLREFGLDLTPKDLWVPLLEQGRPWFQEVIARTTTANFINTLERSLAFIGEKIFVTREDGTESPALLLGLDTRGGLTIKGSEGLQTIHTGSIYPVTV